MHVHSRTNYDHVCVCVCPYMRGGTSNNSEGTKTTVASQNSTAQQEGD